MPVELADHNHLPAKVPQFFHVQVFRVQLTGCLPSTHFHLLCPQIPLTSTHFLHALCTLRYLRVLQWPEGLQGAHAQGELTPPGGPQEAFFPC